MWILISEPSFVSTFGKRDKPISWNKMWLGEKMIITSLESRFSFVSDKETFFAPTNFIWMNLWIWFEWSRYLSVKILFANITFDKQLVGTHSVKIHLFCIRAFCGQNFWARHQMCTFAIFPVRLPWNVFHTDITRQQLSLLGHQQLEG